MEFAEIVWDKGVPKSKIFDDFYFSSDSGIDESYYNFISHNFLEDRFLRLEDNREFIVIETGFGSGLNFLLTLGLWKKNAPKSTTLRFISIEKYPLKSEDLVKILNLFPKVDKSQLIEKYYITNNGLNNYKFDNVELDLVVDDICNLKNYSFQKADAWFLDGFTPARNEEMWTEELFHNISSLSYKGTTFATFTASSLIRKRLQKYGFEVRKDKGFGEKREMMYGFYK